MHRLALLAARTSGPFSPRKQGAGQANRTIAPAFRLLPHCFGLVTDPPGAARARFTVKAQPGGHQEPQP